MRRKLKAENERLRSEMARAYWTIRGHDAVKELLAVERILSDALQNGAGAAES